MGLTVNNQNKVDELFGKFALDPKKPREEQKPKNKKDPKDQKNKLVKSFFNTLFLPILKDEYLFILGKTVRIPLIQCFDVITSNFIKGNISPSSNLRKIP